MTTQDLRAELLSAKTKGQLVEILGYIDSSGTVKDLMIGFENNYRSLAKQSLELLPKIDKPAHIDFETWNAAYSELHTSYTRYLSAPAQKTNDNARGGSVVNVDGCTYAPDVSTIDSVIVILDVEKFSETLVHQGEVKVANSKPKTIAKDWIKSQLPESRYIPRLNLSTGKFRSIRVTNLVHKPNEKAHDP